jgi:hypothetical protein
MADKKIADLFSIRSRFLRSVNLERDFEDPSAFSGYVPTEFTKSCFGRIAQGLNKRSGQRAWRMTGDYGSGKSSFALLLAQSFAGCGPALPPQLRSCVDFSRHGLMAPKFMPILVTCARQSLNRSILEALHRVVSKAYSHGGNSKLAENFSRLLRAKNGPSDQQVIDAILSTNSRIILDGKGKGLLLILDELGKFLEFAALNTQQQDVFLLQRLAEEASRSGDEPLFVVCVLHQGFNAYAEQLNQAAQREWEKVAGRFEEIIFNQPVEQIASLILRAAATPRSARSANFCAMCWECRFPVANWLK